MQLKLKNSNSDIPKPFRITMNGKLEIPEGGGCLCVFGLPFLAIGIFLALVATRIVPMERVTNQPEWSLLIVGFMALPFIAAGVWLFFGRRKIIIDTTSRQIYRQLSLLVALKKETTYLHDYERIVVRLESSDTDSIDSYPVFLKAKPTARDLRMFYSADYGNSRLKAEFLAKFLCLPLEDASSDHTKLYTAHSAGITLTERLKSGIEECKDMPLPGQKMRSLIKENKNAFEITVPHKSFNPIMFLPILFSLLLWLFLRDTLFPFFRVSSTPEAVGWIISIFINIIFIAIPLLTFIRALINAIKGYSRLIITPEQIRICESTGLRQQTISIALTDIVDIDYNTVQDTYRGSLAELSGKMARQDYRYAAETKKYGPTSLLGNQLAKFAKSRGLIIKTKKGMFYFGYGLEDGEVLYLYFRIKNALKKQAQGI